MCEITFVEIKDRHYAHQESEIRRKAIIFSPDFLILVPCITATHYINNIEQVGLPFHS